MSTFAAQIAFSLQRKIVASLLVVAMSFYMGLSGLALSCLNECESMPTEAELVEIEILIAEKSYRRRTVRQRLCLLSGLVSAMLISHSSEQLIHLSATSRAEHALRNGGIGAPLRC